MMELLDSVCNYAMVFISVVYILGLLFTKSGMYHIDTLNYPFDRLKMFLVFMIIGSTFTMEILS